ncbi:surface antigen BspA-like [Trichomonas vaginalis G3]|uniref:Surface antigen BspA-like n=1 Tax=Trichomonas vaginalis (strain ATCC PRA-98 / G3) TaxID=412133 RepID=A2DLF6_TRIV3|nr:leucine-rich repeats (6 copies)-containing protein [Trichomonas vaginalis G3]EAY18774.1 surface antigen BspA-like [Trichomonas vaginalis G3]KAI5539290.1 leucine-rich repeats (6 copies)-containing protein [Trichomonas vaginalis G3]|eukprot:XP_001579760.1 surface antigen BspA-like [Trichomonas vaginalis G3]
MLSLLLSASICKADIQYDGATGTVTVTANEEWTADEWYSIFSDIKNFTKAVLKGTYTAIPREAFSGAINMTEIDIQAPIVNISAYAFAQCNSLKTFTLPDSVQIVGYAAFSSCENLESFYWKNTNRYFGEYCFYNCPKLATFDHAEGDQTQPIEGKKFVYSNFTFQSCIALKTCNLHPSVRFIAPHLFDGCSSLATFTLPENVTIINDFSFSACGLTTFDASQIATINQFGFAGCLKLHTIKLSDKLRYIGPHAFETCIELQTVEGITNNNDFTIDDSVFEGALSLVSFHVPECMTKIPDYVFHNAQKLASVNIPIGVTYIGKYAFLNTSITEIYLQGNVTTIREGAFGALRNLKKITVTETNFNFKSVNNLLMTKDGKIIVAYPQDLHETKITIPDGAEYIGQYCYSYASSATEVVFPKSVIDIGLHAFAGCKSIQSITLPEHVETISDYAFQGCTGLIEINIQAKSICLGAFENCKSLKRVTFPAQLELIGNEAFRNCASLNEVNLQNCVNLTYLGNATFIFCSGLKKVTLPDKIRVIPNQCFFYCSNLQSFTFPPNVRRIRDHAFSYCKNLKSITLPEGLTNLGTKAFHNTALTHITVPANVSFIPNGVFSDIPTLETAEFKGVLRSFSANVFANDARLTKIQFWDDVKNFDKLALEGTRILNSILYCGQVAVEGTFVEDHTRIGSRITVQVGSDYPIETFGGVKVEKTVGICIPHRTPQPTPLASATPKPDNSKNKKLYIAIGVSAGVIILAVVAAAFIVKCCMVKRGWVKKETLTESLLTQTV